MHLPILLSVSLGLAANAQSSTTTTSAARRVASSSTAAVAVITSSPTSTAAAAVDTSATSTTSADPWTPTGSDSFYWHNRYHGILAMAAYGDYNTTCQETFTAATLQVQYPGNTNAPWTVVGTWGPTPIYGSEGFMVAVPEMNKILMVFKGIYGWQNFNATLVPYLNIGCDTTCMVHASALAAWAEVKNATNDMQAIKDNQGDLIFSSTGHGFGGMISQVAALDLKYRDFAYASQSFGAPPVFNAATAAVYDSLFASDSSQRTVANEDSIPAAIPIGSDGTSTEYVFVNTGIHVYGTNTTYGQNYVVCEDDPSDPECGGGTIEADHYFYFTDIGTCGEAGYAVALDETFDYAALASDVQEYNQTATAALLTSPITTFSTPTATPSSSSLATSTITLTSTPASAVADSASASSSAVSSTSAAIRTSGAGKVGGRKPWAVFGLTLLGGVLVWGI